MIGTRRRVSEEGRRASPNAVQPMAPHAGRLLTHTLRATHRRTKKTPEIADRVDPGIWIDLQPRQDRGQFGGNRTPLVATHLTARPIQLR